MILLEFHELGVFYSNFIFKLVDLQLVLEYRLLFRLVCHLLIDRGLVLDYLGPGCKAESGQSLVVVDRRRRDRANDGRQRVAAQSHLQDARQLRVSVGNVGWFTLCKLVYHIWKHEKTLVDETSFSKMISFAIEFIQAFWSRQINQVKHRIFLVKWVLLWPALYVQAENGMRSRWMLMDACFLIDSMLFSVVQENNRLVKWVNLLFIQYCNIDTML